MKGIARSHWLPEPILPARNFLRCFPKKIFVSVHIYKNAKMNLVDIHSYKWFWHKCSLFRFLNWFLFSEEKEDIVVLEYLVVFSSFLSLRSWRYCVGARLKFWRRSRVPKKRE